MAAGFVLLRIFFVVPGDHPPLLPTATGRPRGGLPAVGRVSEGGHVSMIRGREEGAPLTVLVVYFQTT